MDYTLNSFVISLRDKMYSKFPYESDSINRVKHMGPMNKHPKPKHIRDVAFKDIPYSITDNISTFEIGSEEAEENYPYYHILQDSPTIHKKDRGDKRSRGSQAKVYPLGKRDYGIVRMTARGNFTKEYSKNVRGARASVLKNATYKDSSGNRFNPTSNSYLNTHYKYIDRMLNEIAPIIASEFGMTFKGTSGLGLGEEFLESEYGIMFEDYDTARAYSTKESIATIMASFGF